ncbi:M1 family metallopeptidase [soil metagenome]
MRRGGLGSAAVGSLILAITLGLFGGDATARSSPDAGIGDDYFPLDGNRGLDVRAYDIDISYDMTSAHLSGVTTVSVRATRPLATFNLDLLLPASSVRVDSVAASFAQAHHELTITPQTPVAKGESFAVEVTYAGDPRNYTYANESNWLSSPDEVVAMNQPHMAPWWFPANDHPRDAALMDISVTTDADRDVVAVGHRVSRTEDGTTATTRWVSDEPMATYLAFFAAGDYWIEQGRSHGADWLVAVSNDLTDTIRSRARASMLRTPAITGWLVKKIAAYPFNDNGGLVTGLPVSFALENQTRPVYPAAWVNDSLLVHELAHQWFGDSVRLHSWRDIWLNEGWASYLEWVWSGSHGGMPAKARLEQHYRGAQRGFWSTPTLDPGPKHIFDSDAVYTRGAMALAALRNRIGSQDFWRLAHVWATKRAGRTGTTKQFVANAEEISGEKLDGFFRAWLVATGKPRDSKANGLGF